MTVTFYFFPKKSRPAVADADRILELQKNLYENERQRFRVA